MSTCIRTKKTPLPVGLSLPDQPHPAEDHVPSFVRNDIMYRPTLSVVGKMFSPGEKSKWHGMCTICSYLVQ